ncbi:hypothetical protein C0989_002129, partial [Termitomyces sp. Mn162]
MPALLEEYLHAQTTPLEQKTGTNPTQSSSPRVSLYSLKGVQKNFPHTTPTITKLISKKASPPHS